VSARIRADLGEERYQGERVAVVVLRRPDPSRGDLDRLARFGADEDDALPKEGVGDWSDELDREDER
jgi:hypothetical protein